VTHASGDKNVTPNLGHRSYGQLVEADSSSTVLVELEESNGNTTLADVLASFKGGRATLSDLTVEATLGVLVPLKISVPAAIEALAVTIGVAIDSTCAPGYRALYPGGLTKAEYDETAHNKAAGGGQRGMHRLQGGILRARRRVLQMQKRNDLRRRGDDNQ
jgi:hypothetical protein